MKVLKHLLQQPFILATGIAALLHSTWSLCTLFSGPEPIVQWSGAWLAWVIPGFFIAFSLDIGAVTTASEIRNGARTPAKYRTFFVLCASTYFLQWMYIAHHMPELTLGAGVRGEWLGLAMLLRDAALWFVPALLPLSTLLYTFSHGNVPIVSAPRKNRKSETTVNIEQANVLIAEQPTLETVKRPALPAGDRSALCDAFFADAQNAGILSDWQNKRISQNKLATTIGVSPSALSRYLSKKRSVE